MNLRHATAFALVGWYLLVPPINPVPATPARHEVERPLLKQYVIAGSFDSEEECQNAMVGLLSLPPVHREADCIASDDPRLKSN